MFVALPVVEAVQLRAHLMPPTEILPTKSSLVYPVVWLLTVIKVASLLYSPGSSICVLLVIFTLVANINHPPESSLILGNIVIGPVIFPAPVLPLPVMLLFVALNLSIP